MRRQRSTKTNIHTAIVTYSVGGLVVHDQLVVDEVERVGLRLVRMLDHFVDYNNRQQTDTNKRNDSG